MRLTSEWVGASPLQAWMLSSALLKLLMYTRLGLSTTCITTCRNCVKKQTETWAKTERLSRRRLLSQVEGPPGQDGEDLHQFSPIFGASCVHVHHVDGRCGEVVLLELVKRLEWVPLVV